MTRLALVLLVLAAGCMSDDSPDADPATVASARFLALGDSYTIGEGVAPRDRWPVQIADSLRAEGAEIADPQIVAVTGWTTAELDAGIDAADPQGPFAVVTLLIGVNNQYRGLSLDAYRDEYRALLTRAVAFADGDASRVVAVSFPDWGVMPFAADRDRDQIAADTDAFNAAAREIAQAAGAAWVDVTPLSRTQGDLAAADGLHPNGQAYTAWAERILPAARAALTR